MKDEEELWNVSEEKKRTLTRQENWMQCLNWILNQAGKGHIAVKKIEITGEI